MEEIERWVLCVPSYQGPQLHPAAAIWRRQCGRDILILAAAVGEVIWERETV
jgi:hypothetical protein